MLQRMTPNLKNVDVSKSPGDGTGMAAFETPFRSLTPVDYFVRFVLVIIFQAKEHATSRVFWGDLKGLKAPC
jgi:hypothetical protein